MAKVEFIDPRIEVFITEEGMSRIKAVQTNLMAKLPEGAKTTPLKGAYTGLLDKLIGNPLSLNINLSNTVGLPLEHYLKGEGSRAILDHKTLNEFEGDFFYLPWMIMYSVATKSIIAMLLVDLSLGTTRKIEANVPITLFTEVDYTDNLPLLLYYGEDNNAVQVTVMIWGDKLRYNDNIDRPMNLVKHLRPRA